MNLKMIDAAIRAYGDTIDEGDAARLDFFRKMWEVQNECAQQVAVDSYEVPAADSLRRLNKSGVAVLNAYPATFDADTFARAIQNVAACAFENGGFDESVCDALKATKWDRILAASNLEKAGCVPSEYLDEVMGILVDDGKSERQAFVGTMLVSYALRSLLEPFAQKIVEAREDAKIEYPHQLFCPVCGDRPSVSHVGEEEGDDSRNRSLWCAQCGTSWSIERIRCAHCGTQNQSSLHFFNIEGDDTHRLATCDECGGYIRTHYSENALIPFSCDVENVMMLRLDAIAQDPTFAGGAAAKNGNDKEKQE